MYNENGVQQRKLLKKLFQKIGKYSISLKRIRTQTEPFSHQKSHKHSKFGGDFRDYLLWLLEKIEFDLHNNCQNKSKLIKEDAMKTFWLPMMLKKDRVREDKLNWTGDDALRHCWERVSDEYSVEIHLKTQAYS